MSIWMVRNQKPDYSRCITWFIDTIKHKDALLKMSNSEIYILQKVNMQNCSDSLYIHFEEFKKQINEIREILRKVV